MSFEPYVLRVLQKHIGGKHTLDKSVILLIEMRRLHTPVCTMTSIASRQQ